MNECLAHITDSNFEETIEKNPLVLIDFWASWCGPCRVLSPIIEELANDYSGRVLIGKLNVDENPNATERLQVFSVPTLILLKECYEIERIVGLVPKKSIEATLEKFF